MNRREMLKTVMVAPLVPVITSVAVSSRSKRIPDWNKLDTDHGYSKFLTSIKHILEKTLNQSVRLERDGGSAGFLVGSVYLFGIATILGQMNHLSSSEYDHIRYTKPERAREYLIRLVETRWANFLWCLNDATNMHITLTRNFDSGYRPEDYRC